MKKRITKSQLGKLIESQVRKMLDENEYMPNSKEEQMASDWAELENINKKYQAEKFSPVLSKHYNHNVEDDRGEAEEYCHGLEEKICRIVEKRLNESANNYQEAIEHLTNAYRCLMQYNKQSMEVGGTPNNSFQTIIKQIGNIIGQINRLNDPWDSKGQENLKQTGWTYI